MLILLLTGATVLLALGAGYLVGAAPVWLPTKFRLLLPLLLFAAVFAIVGARTVIRQPETAMLALVAIFYTNVSEVGVRYYGLPSLLLLGGVLLTLMLAWRFLFGAGQGELVVDVTFVLLVLYGAVIFASTTVAVNTELADERLFDHVKGVLLFLIVTNFTDSRLTLRRVVWVLVLAGAFLGTISVLQVLTGSYNSEFGGFGRIKLAHITEYVYEPRIAGTVSDPNFYAQMLVPLVPLALYRVWDEPTAWLKLVAAYSLGVILLALVFTYSRGGALAAVLVLLLAAIHKRIKLRHLLLGAGCLALLLIVVPTEFGGRLKSLRELVPGGDERVLKEDSSFRQRALLAETAWEMFADHAAFGVGAGNFSEYYDEYAEHVGATVSSYEDFAHRRFPHTLYLEIAAETGLVGLLVFVVVIGVTLFNAWAAVRMFKEAGSHASASLVTSCALGLIGYLTTSLFLHGHYIHYLWLLAALLAAAKHIAARRAPDPHPALVYLDEWLSVIYPTIQAAHLSPARKE
ncbi:MAG TPA: O-antigen ligase family protein [Pyrinomonadaceae bacterium]|jgi:O-antigen ligase